MEAYGIRFSAPRNPPSCSKQSSGEVEMAANPSTPTSELTLRTEKNGDETAVHGSGRITSTTSDLLQKTIRALIPGSKRIFLDLTHVNYIDSSGIGAMVSVYLAASKAQCELKVVNAQPRIRDLFEITKLSAVFENQGGYRGL
jgi:anti-sigma B factor antagonist